MTIGQTQSSDQDFHFLCAGIGKYSDAKIKVPIQQSINTP